MKKTIIFLFLMVSLSGISQSYEWMTSLDFAKKLARTQNKMLFVMWEDAAISFETIAVNKTTGRKEYVSILDNETLNEILWNSFIPVVVSEVFYEDLYKEIEGKRTLRYIDKFNDDSVKIMDANGNILNTRAYFNPDFGFNWEKILKTYAINTTFLNEELRHYATRKNFVTAFRLAKKYIDLAIIKNKDVEKELVDLAFIYLAEAEQYAKQESEPSQQELIQKCNLLRLYDLVLKYRPKRVLRELKKIEEDVGIIESNTYLFGLLNFTAHALLKDEDAMKEWRNKVSLGDIKKVTLILNKN